MAGLMRHRLWLWLFLSGISIPAPAENIAYDQPSPKIHPRLTEHSGIMEKQVYRVRDNVYLAYGYGLANSAMVIGDDGVIIIDVMEDYERGQEVLAEFRKITDKPIKAIVYSHNHIDHVGGVKAFANKEDIASGRIKLIAHSSLMDAVVNWSGMVGPILQRRSSYFAGVFLERGPEGWVNMGIGPRIFAGRATFLPPNLTFDERLELTVAGITMHVIYVPSETNDEIVVWFPDLQVLQTAEVLQGEAFPNLHTLRGTKYRDPVKWYKAVDVLRTFPAEYMVPSHGRPVYGYHNIQATLTHYRDAIQYVHDQSIRLINKGALPEDLAALITLPDHLAQHPWLGEFYGSVKNSVRQFYSGYIGWYQGDPWEVDRMPPLPRAQNYVRTMGGRDAVLAEAGNAIENKEYTWAAEILTYLLHIDAEDKPARLLKARALREWGYQQITSTWRNWALTAAKELEGTLPTGAGIMKSSPDIADALSSSRMVELLSTRLAAERCIDVQQLVGIELTDTAEAYALELRRGIAEFHGKMPAGVSEKILMTRQQLIDLFIGNTDLSSLTATPPAGTELAGDRNKLAEFSRCFEGVKGPPITLSIPVNLQVH